MPDLTAKRTLVKSPPELWEELSEVERLAKHLGAFGEITITKLEPEHTVAWEGEHASGTVSIEPSGWGTKVILTAELAANGDPPEPGADHAGEPAGAGERRPEISPRWRRPPMSPRAISPRRRRPPMRPRAISPRRRRPPMRPRAISPRWMRPPRSWLRI